MFLSCNTCFVADVSANYILWKKKQWRTRKSKGKKTGNCDNGGLNGCSDIKTRGRLVFISDNSETLLMMLCCVTTSPTIHKVCRQEKGYNRDVALSKPDSLFHIKIRGDPFSMIGSFVLLRQKPSFLKKASLSDGEMRTKVVA